MDFYNYGLFYYSSMDKFLGNDMAAILTRGYAPV